MKNNVNQMFSFPIDLHCMDKRYNKSQWDMQLFGYQQSLKKKFYILQKKVSHVWNNMSKQQNFHFWIDYPSI